MDKKPSTFARLLDQLQDWFWLIVIVGLPLALIGGLIYLQWLAYFERFPHASWWTFFIPGGK